MPVHSAVYEAEVGRSLAAHSSGAQKDHLLTVNSAGDAASVSAFLACGRPWVWFSALHCKTARQRGN